MLTRSNRPIQGVGSPRGSFAACTPVSAPNTTTVAAPAIAPRRERRPNAAAENPNSDRMRASVTPVRPR